MLTIYNRWKHSDLQGCISVVLSVKLHLKSEWWFRPCWSLGKRACLTFLVGILPPAPLCFTCLEKYVVLCPYCCWLLSRFYFMILFFLSYLYMLQAISFIEAYLFWVITNETAFDVLRIPLLYNLCQLAQFLMILLFYLFILFHCFSSMPLFTHTQSCDGSVLDAAIAGLTSFRPNVRLDSGNWNRNSQFSVCFNEWLNECWEQVCVGLCVCATNIARGHTGPYLLLTVSAVVFFRSPALKKRDLLLLTWSEITDLDHNAYFFFFLKCVVKSTHYLWDSRGGNGC